MVALGELEHYLLLFLPLHNSEYTTGNIKYWYDDHSYRKSVQVAMDISIGLNQMLYHGFFFPQGV